MKSVALRPSQSSWLAMLPTPISQHLAAGNKQIVPRIPLQDCSNTRCSCAATRSSRTSSSSSSSNAWPTQQRQQRVRTAAALTQQQHQSTSAEDVVTSRARLYALYEYVHSNNRLPDLRDTCKGVAVGQWAEKCRLQMQLQQQAGLDPELIAALQSIPGWDWTPQTSSLSDCFHDRLQQLRGYVQRHGMPPLRSTSRPPSSTGPSGPSIAELEQAVAISKTLVEQRKRGVLTQEQINAVSSTVPGWKWDPRFRSPPLDDSISALQAYQRQHGRLPSADVRLENGFLLGDWCAARRGEARRGELELDVAAALETHVPGWQWDRLENVFERNLEALLGFVHAHGRTPTQREEWGGVRVGAWANKRRLQYKAGMLPADRVAALEAVPGWWWSCDQMPEAPLQMVES